MQFNVKRDGDGWRWEAARPKGATALHVGFRPATWRQENPQAAAKDRDTALAALTAANKEFSFEELASREGHRPWTGKIAEAGWLRLVATGRQSIHVGVVEIKKLD